MEKVRTANAVRDRLYKVHEERLAGLLFGAWLQLAALGEDATRKKYSSRATFFRHRKLLMDAGCSWYRADVVLRELSLVPSDFTPSLADSRRVSVEASKVVELLAAYRTAG